MANNRTLRIDTDEPTLDTDGNPVDTGGGGGMPSGTAAGQYVRYNGSVWEAVTLALTTFEGDLTGNPNILTESEIDTDAEFNALIEGSLSDDYLGPSHRAKSRCNAPTGMDTAMPSRSVFCRFHGIR